MTEPDPPTPPLSPAGVARREQILRAAIAAARGRRRRRTAGRLGAVAVTAAAAALIIVLARPRQAPDGPPTADVRPAPRQPVDRPATAPVAPATAPADRVVVSFITIDPELADRAAIRSDNVRWIRLDGDGLLAALTTDGRAGGGLVVRDGRAEVWVPPRRPPR